MVISGPSCSVKRAVTMAASERKVLFLHDDYENATILRRQMADLSKALDQLHVVSYFGNSPTQVNGGDRASGAGSDETRTENFACVWYGGDQNLLKETSYSHLVQLSKRKGPFYAVVAVGKACQLARLIARAHQCQAVEPNLKDTLPHSDNEHSYPVCVVSSTQFFTFDTVKNTELTAVLPMPVEEIADFVGAAVREGSLFNIPVSTREQVQQEKLMKKQRDKELIQQRTAENNERKLLKARKAAGEDVVVPPNKTRLLRKERRELRETLRIAEPVAIIKSSGDSTTKLCNYILAPMAEPVTPCMVDDLAEMIQYLKSNAKIADNEKRVDFMKGSVLNHGGMAVDLCKQVVGPCGIEPVLEAVGHNQNVVRFLLGNNISGDRGAKAVANFITDKERSKNVYCFYLAGNEIGPVGMADIAQSLQHDEKVQALWLKRNPIGPEGARHLAATLRLNTILQTLDLVNVGMFDDGAVAIFEALTAAVDTTGLRHLYLGSNGLTVRTAVAAGAFLETGKSKLQTLYFAAGRLGDDGMEALSRGLANDVCLTRLGLASERIGCRGAMALADALEHHPTLLSLDLGLRKGTYMLGERPNQIGDAGVVYLARKLLRSRKGKRPLRSLDVSHNGISNAGLHELLDIVEAQTEQSLLVLRVAQHGLKWDIERLNQLINRNKEHFEQMKKSVENAEEVAVIEEALNPRHIFDIYSIYRNNM